MVYYYFPLGRDNNDCEPHSVRSNSWTFCKIKISWKFVASFNSHASKWFRRTNDNSRRLWVLNDFKFEKYFKRLPLKFDSAHFGDIRFLEAWLLISVLNSKRTFFQFLLSRSIFEIIEIYPFASIFIRLLRFLSVFQCPFKKLTYPFLFFGKRFLT